MCSFATQSNLDLISSFMLWEATVWTFCRVPWDLLHTIPAEFVTRVRFYGCWFGPDETRDEHYSSDAQNRDTET